LHIKSRYSSVERERAYVSLVFNGIIVEYKFF